MCRRSRDHLPDPQVFAGDQHHEQFTEPGNELARSPSIAAVVCHRTDPYAGTQVFSTGQTTAHCGVSKCPTHSVHFLGSMMYMSFLRRMAALGHSNSQAPHTVHCDAMIL